MEKRGEGTARITRELASVHRPLARVGAAFLREFIAARRLTPDRAIQHLARAHEEAATAAQVIGRLTSAEQRALSDFAALGRVWGLTPSSRHEEGHLPTMRRTLAQLRAGQGVPIQRPSESERAEATAQWRGALIKMHDDFESCLLGAYSRGRRAGRDLSRDQFASKLREAVNRLRANRTRLTKAAVAVEIGMVPKSLDRYLTEYGVPWPPSK